MIEPEIKSFLVLQLCDNVTHTQEQERNKEKLEVELIKRSSLNKLSYTHQSVKSPSGKIIK